MKKNILILSSALLLSASVFMIGCKKDDTTAPVVTLNGASSQTISLQGTYTDLGATANDDKDGAITPVASGSVNVNETGVYTITYTATDAAGNEGSVDRTITVVNDADKYAGSYSVSEVCTPGGNSTYPQTIKASTSFNNRLVFSKFGNYTGADKIYATIIGTNMDIVSQTATLVGTPAANRTFSGSATAITTTGFVLNYTELTNGTTASCVATFTR